jgi:hypothetical protein
MKELSINSPEASTVFKNIQRRVYDALNVMSAINYITKLRNEISFNGVTNRNNGQFLGEAIAEKKNSVESKRKILSEKFLQYIAIYKLCERNKEHPRRDKVAIPFVLLFSSSPSYKISV